MKELIAVTIILPFLIYGGFVLQRNINYKFGYKSMVREEIKPLEKKIKELEIRISNLESNSLVIIYNTNLITK